MSAVASGVHACELGADGIAIEGAGVDGAIVTGGVRGGGPADAELVDDAIEGASAGGVDDGESGDAVDDAEVSEFDEGLGEGGAVAEVAAGDDDPVGERAATTEAEVSEDAAHDGFLTFEAEGVDAVEEVDAAAGVFGDLADAGEAGVEVAGDLEGGCAVVEGLAELAEGDLAGADEDEGADAGVSGVEGEGGAGVSGAGAGDDGGVDHSGVGEAGGHAVVFEGAGGVHALVLEVEVWWSGGGPAAHAEGAGECVGFLEDGFAFADGDDVACGAVEGEEFAELPDAGAFGACGVAAEEGEVGGEAVASSDGLPVVDDVEEGLAAAGGCAGWAGGEDGVDGELRPAVGEHAALARDGVAEGHRSDAIGVGRGDLSAGDPGAWKWRAAALLLERRRFTHRIGGCLLVSGVRKVSPSWP